MKIFETKKRIYALAIGSFDGLSIDTERDVKNYGREDVKTVVTLGKIHFPSSLVFNKQQTTYYIFLCFRLIVCKKNHMRREKFSITSEEYKEAFIKTIVDTAQVQPNDVWIALAEYEAQLEAEGNDYVGDPVFDAHECMSCWSD